MDIKKLISNMTIEEKAGLCSGDDFWHTKAVKRLNIPTSMVSDGPSGLRKQDTESDHAGFNDSIKAVCFPTNCCTAASFDRRLLEQIGKIIGNECQSEEISVILGPAMNIKRSPLCGRNFEYYSEDPYLAGELASAMVKGVQSKNIGTSPKHFLANSQEHRRMSSSSEVDERTLREIYMAAFENVVKRARPWTIMCSYNKINGTFASESKLFLTDILREEWGFDGYVVSDWGAVNERVKGLKAGLDLEMPSSGGINDRNIIEAIKNKTLSEEVLDQAVERILNIVYRYKVNRDESAIFDLEADHQFAQKAAEDSIVLLKNEGNILPIKDDKTVAFIGKYASKPRYQGGGSSHVNSFKVTSAIEAVKGFRTVKYAKGFDDTEDKSDSVLLQEAIETAKSVDVAVIFAGLPDSFESEGFDRNHMQIPQCQLKLIDKICEVQSNTIVVLHNGSPIEMPFVYKVKGIIEAYLGGQAVGAAVANILFGEVNPSGRLPETFPIKMKDNPSYLYYFGERDKVEYREGVFVGYRYYDTKEMEVLFPFGYGLSYTDYEYTDLRIVKNNFKDSDKIVVEVDVTNIGERAGKEVVQLYVSAKDSPVIRPVHELKGFEKIELEPHETKTIKFELDMRAFAYWNNTIHDWHITSGHYAIQIGKSSRDIVLEKDIYLETNRNIPVKYSLNTLFGDLYNNEEAMQIIKPLYDKVFNIFTGAALENKEEDSNGREMAMMMIKYMPLRGTLSFGNEFDNEDLQKFIDELNSLNE